MRVCARRHSMQTTDPADSIHLSHQAAICWLALCTAGVSLGIYVQSPPQRTQCKVKVQSNPQLISTPKQHTAICPLLMFILGLSCVVAGSRQCAFFGQIVTGHFAFRLSWTTPESALGLGCLTTLRIVSAILMSLACTRTCRAGLRVTAPSTAS